MSALQQSFGQVVRRLREKQRIAPEDFGDRVGLDWRILAGMEQVAERTRAALRYKRDKGERLGTTPLGYRTPEAGSAMVPDPAELETVQYILRRRRHGLASFRAIAAELTERRAPKRGRAWHASTVRAIWSRRARYRLAESPPECVSCTSNERLLYTTPVIGDGARAVGEGFTRRLAGPRRRASAEGHAPRQASPTTRGARAQRRSHTGPSGYQP